MRVFWIVYRVVVSAISASLTQRTRYFYSSFYVYFRVLVLLNYIHRVFKKLSKIVFAKTSSNFHHAILIIFGTQIAKRIGKCEMHSFPPHLIRVNALPPYRVKCMVNLSQY